MAGISLAVAALSFVIGIAVKHFLGIEQDGKIEFVRGPIVTETDGTDFSKFSKYYKINVE